MTATGNTIRARVPRAGSETKGHEVECFDRFGQDVVSTGRTSYVVRGAVYSPTMLIRDYELGQCVTEREACELLNSRVMRLLMEGGRAEWCEARESAVVRMPDGTTEYVSLPHEVRSWAF